MDQGGEVHRWSPAGPCAFRRPGRDRHERFRVRHRSRDGGRRKYRTRQQSGLDPPQPSAHGLHGPSCHVERRLGSLQGRIGPVQHPGQQERDSHVHGRHHGRSLMPGVSVGRTRHHGSAQGPCRRAGVRDVGERLPRGAGEHQMQYALDRQRASGHDQRGEVPSGRRPHADELQDQRREESPGHGRAPGRLVPQRRQHTARQGEHPRTDTGAQRIDPLSAHRGREARETDASHDPSPPSGPAAVLGGTAAAPSAFTPRTAPLTCFA